MHWDNDCTLEQSKDGAILYANTFTMVARKNPFYKCGEKSGIVGLRLVQTYLEFKNKQPQDPAI
jgi:hypothetical protein